MHSRIRALPPAVLALVFALPPGAIDSARTATLDVSVRDPGARAIADAVIVAVPVQGVPRAKGERPKEVIDQIDKEFVPGVKVIQVGTAISFPNKDNIRHHVYSFSPAKKFELPLYKGVPAAPIVFDKPGVVVLGCNIHDWMIAYVYVVESPWFGKTEQAGQVRILDLPAGEYDVEAYHPRAMDAAEPIRRRVTIGAATPSAIEVQMTLKPAARSSRPPKGAEGEYP